MLTASSLDNSRLFKQCVEAKQLIDILTRMNIIANKLGMISIPTKIVDEDGSSKTVTSTSLIEDRVKLWNNQLEWYHSTLKEYLSKPFRFGIVNGKLKKLPVKMLSAKDYILHRDTVITLSKKQPHESSMLVHSFSEDQDSKCQKVTSDHGSDTTHCTNFFDMKSEMKLYCTPKKYFLLPGNEHWSMGFSSHPAVKMWIGHLDNLKFYYNTCLREVLRREIHNTKMEMYPLGELSTDQPWWMGCRHVILSHRVSLLRKQPSVYSKIFSENITRYKDCGYVWVSSLTLEQQLDMVHDRCRYRDICCEVKK